jgi:hypothetical protein
MGLLAPLALAFVPVLGLIIALYLLRLRRPETPVSSLLLWRALLRDQEANAPWQRLSTSLLLLLQLAIAAVLILALARPWSVAATPGGSNLVIVLDTSASMGATDGLDGRTRLAEAVRDAWARISALPANGTAALIAAGNHARIVSPATGDRDALRRALDTLQPAPTATDLSEALSLAAGVAAASADPEVLVYSDGQFPDPRGTVPALAAPLHFVAMGARGANQAIIALSVRRTAATLSLLAQVANADTVQVTRRLDIELDGVAWAGRTLTLPPGETTQVLFDEVPPGAQVVQAHLAGADDLAVDDTAWTINHAAEPAPVLLVTDGNRFLQNALVLLPNVALDHTIPADYSPELTATLTVFDRTVPSTTLPTGNLLFVAPPTSTTIFEVTGVLTTPNPLPQVAPASVDPGTAPTDGAGGDPLLRYTDLSDLHIARAAHIARPPWARVVLDSDSGPLILAGEVEGHRVVIIGFDLHDSDLPLQMSYPLLMRNLVGYLLPEAAGDLAASVQPGDPVPLAAAVQEGVDRLTVRGPGGAQLASYTVGPDQFRFTFNGADTPGVYIVSQWVGAREVRREGFTANLFSLDEARTAPRADPPLPAGRPVGAADVSDVQTGQGQFEWWQGLAALALLALIAEWLITHRLGLRQLGRRLRGRPLEDPLGHP